VKLRVGVVGVGRWGKNIARALSRLVEFELVAVCDPEPQELGVAQFSSLGEMLSQVELKAVVIATPPESHAELSRVALAKGVHVLVEKPMCISTAQARELLLALDGASARLMVGHLLLFHPAVRGIERLREHGRLGGPVRVEVERWSQPGRAPSRCPWWTLAPHDLALLERWFGPPLRVSATRRSQGDVSAELEFAAGCRARLSLRTDATTKRRRVVINAMQSKVVFDDLGSHKLVVLEGGRARPVVIASEAPLDEELRHFSHALRTGARFDADAAQGLSVVSVLEAGEQSLTRAGAWVACAPEIARYGS
jgi:predicted dehydrogenase